METLNEYLQRQTDDGYGVALIDAKTGKILTPYLGSEFGSGGWDTPSDWKLDGEANLLDVKAPGLSLQIHSGSFEETWREQRRAREVR